MATSTDPAAGRPWPGLLAWFALALGAHLLLRRQLGLTAALGSDAALWGLSALNLQVGAPSLIPPGYPALVALLEGMGVSLVTAGWLMSTLAGGGLVAWVWWLARRLGAPAPAAHAAAGLTLLHPGIAAWAQQLQPDSTTALALLALAGLLSGAAGEGTAARRSAWGAAVLGGVALPLLREHGLVLAPLTAVVLLWLRHRRPAAATLGLWWLGPLVVGQSPGVHPLDLPWSARPSGALDALTTTRTDGLNYVREMPPDAAERYLQLVRDGDHLTRIGWHASRSLNHAWDSWAWLALGAGLALAGRRRSLAALGAPMLCALPALVVWSKPRHVLLAVPAALVLVAVASARLPRALQAGLAALALALCWPLVDQGRFERTVQASEQRKAEPLMEVAQWLADNARPGDLLGTTFREIALYHPMPYHTVGGGQADHRTWVVVDRPLQDDDWRQVWVQAEGLRVYQHADPEGSCPDGRAAPDTPYIVIAGRAAALVGCP